ncbi:MAG TPA: TetR/AcrR family transcriptional regulator [Solirubrobacteraceae bacterium]|jgi:AcrR family transcriptional regulator|nr:TetR/AcrR family transcriptional regulator [Solirubrobacteraceae bacterium]
MTGLRETKKRRTREAIAQAAAHLFREHGFESVTVDDVARTADVSRQTVFNYFPTKEQMLFDREEEIAEALLALVAGPHDGASLVAAFRRHTREFWERFGAILSRGGETHGFWEIVRASPALRDYAEASFGRQARRAGDALAQAWNRPPDDPTCHALARALCGVNVAFLTCGMERLSDGEDAPTVVADMITQSGEAYAALERGLGQFVPASTQ